MRTATLSFLICVGLLAGSLTRVWAQEQTVIPPKPTGVNLQLADGQQITATGFRMDGSTLLATQAVGNSVGEIGYPLANVRKIDFPEPTPLTTAADLLAQGKTTEALAQIEPIVAYYAPFRNVPGNWWLPAALIKADALAGLKREREVDTLLGDLARLPNNPPAAEAARLRVAEAQARRGEPGKAAGTFRELIKTSLDSDVLARAWVGIAQGELAAGNYDAALLAFLRVPVLYPDCREALPAATLGSGRAFAGLEDSARATTAFQAVVASYPASPEAEQAKAELQKPAPGQTAAH